MGQDALLAGRYRLVSPLGRGGMGQVWEGRDERLGRQVAVKLLTHQALAGSPEPENGVRRFIREAAVTAGMSHPGVPAIYDAGEYDGGLYLVMELVSGVTVADLVAEQGPLPVPWVAAIGAQVAAVLAAAHARGVVHRDIKPANVMVAGDGAVTVLDFGVAGIVSQRITSTGVAVGTPAYMAPEQLHDQPATPASDLYALGCLLYEMLSGSPVFSATSPAALMRMHLEQAPAPLTRADVPVSLTQLVWQLLAKDAALRPSGAREVFDRLLAFAGPAGTLGDINPAGPDPTGTLLYARLLARMAEPGPGPGRGPGQQQAAAGPATRRRPPAVAYRAAPRPRRALWHSLWVVPALAPLGLGTWLSFCYIGVRHGRRDWLVIGAGYFVLLATGISLLVIAPLSGPLPPSTVAGFVLLCVIWPAGFIHAVWVNATVRLPLLAAGIPPGIAPKR